MCENMQMNAVEDEVECRLLWETIARLPLSKKIAEESQPPSSLSFFLSLSPSLSIQESPKHPF